MEFIMLLYITITMCSKSESHAYIIAGEISTSNGHCIIHSFIHTQSKFLDSWVKILQF